MSVAEKWMTGPRKFKIIDAYYTLGNKSSRRTIIELETEVNDEDVVKEPMCALLAPAGMGRAQLMRQCKKDVHAGRLKQLQGRTIITLDFSGLSMEKEYLPREVLFGNASQVMRGNSFQNGFNWMKTHSEQLVFFVGSLLDLPFALDQAFPALLNYEKAAKVEVICHNLFTGKFFPKSYIMSTCCNTLSGVMSSQSWGNKRIRENFMKQSDPKLWPLMNNPACMMMASSSFGVNTDFQPCTMTGIIVKRALKESQARLGRRDYYISVVDRLKGLSYYGVTKGRVSFSDSELQRFGLSKSDFEGFAFLIPRDNSLQQVEYYNRMEEEFLAAFHMMSMDMGDFNEFMDKNMQNEYYSVVRRCLCGLLFDSKAGKVARQITKVEFQHLPEKRRIVIQYLHKALMKEIRHTSERLSLFATLCECQNGLGEIIKTRLDKAIFMNHPVNLTDMQPISYVVQHCLFLSQMVMVDCTLDDSKMEIFERCVLMSGVKMDLLDISGNPNLEPQSFHRIARIIEHCEVKQFYANSCDIRVEHVKRFVEGIGQARMNIISLGNAPRIGAEGIYQIGRICSLCKVKHLHMFHSDVKPHVKRFTQGHAAIAQGPCGVGASASVEES